MKLHGTDSVRLPRQAVASGTTVLVASLLFRTLHLVLAIMCDAAAEDFDHSTDVFTNRRRHQGDALLRWDALQYAAIEREGYRFEQQHAFYPGLPQVIWGVRVVTGLSFVHAAILFNYVSSLVAAYSLLKLLELRHSGERNFVPVFGALAFIFSPGSIFAVSPYTEMPCAAASFATLYFLQRCEIHHTSLLQFSASLLAAIMFGGLAATMRSNGILMLLPLGAVFLRELAAHRFSPFVYAAKMPLRCVVVSALGLLALIALVAPSLILSVFGMARYCSACPPFLLRMIPEPLRLHFSSGGSAMCRPWCLNRTGLTPMYAFVQSEYWDVGFLKYYRWRNTPQFVLATPALVGVLHCVMANISAPGGSFALRMVFNRTISGNSYIYETAQLLILCTFVIFWANVQVLTRLIVTSAVYWEKLGTLADNACNNTASRMEQHILSLHLGSAVLFTTWGTLTFANYLPWT